MRKMIGIMMIVLVMVGCNNGMEERLAAEKGLSEIGRSVENVFYSFIDLIAGTLGFRVDKDTTRNKVGEYFNNLGKKIGEASGELEKVAGKAVADGDKDGILSKTIKDAVVEAAKATLSVLKGHLDSLGTVGDDSVVGDAETTQKEGTAPDDEELKKAYKALKGIVDIAGKEGVAKPEAGATAVKVGSADNKDGAKILSTGTDKPTSGDSGKAAAILTTVSGKEILAAIVKSGEGDAAVGSSSDASGTTSSMSFSRGGDGAKLANDKALAGAVSGGIALRALVKGSKLGAGGASDAQGGEKEVQKVGITAVNKLLVAVEDVIKRTVKNVLDKAKEKIDEARKSKTVNNE